ncbi:asparaginase [Pelagibacterium xiamenense]|uniref:asparaginase n=1 Tax=Pelagibacterium xiamenense TaxID=2901140 RepID=UPI001E30EE02|nr:asparaginase [Pelagibacterium xiamenense]MCD7061078.1 asparaginase [Pelagibacterium xiamenense]
MNCIPAICFGKPAALTAALTMAFATGTAFSQEAPSSGIPEFPETVLGQHSPDLKNIIVLDTGGTITASAVDRISYLNYGGDNGPADGVLTILEDMQPEIDGIANITLVDLASNDYSIGSSGSLTNEKLFTISQTIDAYLADPDVDGLVLTAGTNVLEEDAYFFDLTVQSPKPVVLTGSMHQYGTFTYDGITNLFSSIRLAADGGTTCFGTVVLLNDNFYPAREVTKTDGYKMSTFDARLYGPFGVVNQDNIRIMRAPARVQDCGTDAWATPFELSTITVEDLPIVDVIMSHIEASPAIIEGAVAGGAEGIIIAGHGPGGISNFQRDARDAALEAGVAIVSASRTGGEGNYDSGEGDVINAADLQPLKARILLQLALAFSDDFAETRELFTSYGTGEFEPFSYD